MRRWPTISLEEVAAFTNGGAWKQSEYVETGIPVVRVSDIRDGTIDLDACKYLPVKSLDKYEKHILYKGDLVVSTVGSHPTQPASMVGKPAIVPSSAHGALLNQNAVRISPTSDRLDKQYLGYLGQSQVFRDYIAQCARGAASQVRMSIELFKKMEIPLPPLPTQRKIAAILSAYDDLIENNTRRIAILEDMAQAIYREWFVHFRFPGHEGVRMVESELGPVPEGWEVVKLGDVVELAYGKGLKADKRIPGHIPVYGSSGIVGYHNQSLVDGPGIIVGRKGNVGSVFWSDDNFFPIDTVFFVRTKVCLHYVYYNLQYQHFIDADVAVPGLKRSQAYSLPFIVPPKAILDGFQGIVIPIVDQLRNLRQKNLNLRQTRDLLLPRLVSGELDVSELDIDTGAPDT